MIQPTAKLSLQGSATLSMAYAGALFADACLRGLNGDPDVVECTYVASTITEVPFFSSKVKLGKNGEWWVWVAAMLAAPNSKLWPMCLGALFVQAWSRSMGSAP